MPKHLERRRKAEPIQWDQKYELVFDHLTYVESTIARLAQLADETSNDSVRLGALKAGLEARARHLSLQQAAGMLPWDLRLVKGEVSVRGLAEEIFQFLREIDFFGTDEEAEQRTAQLRAMLAARKSRSADNVLSVVAPR